MAKKKLDSLMKESKIRDREDPDNFTITALPPSGKSTDKTRKQKVKKSTVSVHAHEVKSNTNTEVRSSEMKGQ